MLAVKTTNRLSTQQASLTTKARLVLGKKLGTKLKLWVCMNLKPI